MNQRIPAETDYSGEYDRYWSSADRVGESSGNMDRTADQIVSSCGIGNILDIGSGEGALVAALLRRGLDARGLDASGVVVSRCNEKIPGHFIQGSVLTLPFPDKSFDTVVSTDCMEHLVPGDVPIALKEIHRIARRNVFLQVATTQDRDDHWHLTVQGRAWWESRCLESGFRKHPAYYRINDYEALNWDGWQVCILMETIPDAALIKYPLASLNAERGLHMDMLRDTGERSDAHVVRYQWACRYIKPGDRVLDAACGLGYGGHVIRHQTQAESIVGIDGSEYAVDYANQSYSAGDGTVRYHSGMLPAALAEFRDGEFDVILSFETLEHVENPEELLQEFCRLLSPGGRVVVSVPNDWSDETGRDPNPFHLHVYDWGRLRGEISTRFILEEAFAQTASQCKVASHGNTWQRRPRSLRQVRITDGAPAECEWWLMTGMKSPLGATQEYREGAFRNISNTGHPSIRYAETYNNPWLMHSMVNVGYRLKRDEELEHLAAEVMASVPSGSNDFAAALCVKAYRLLGHETGNTSSVEEVIAKIEEITAQPQRDLTSLRWKVSLLFVKGKLLQTLGRLEEARDAFVECGNQNVRAFGIHLATKTTEAWFVAGLISYALGQREQAKSCWARGVDSGSELLSVSIDEIAINREFPNRFNHGDGIREYTVAWDNIARCANGLHLMQHGGEMTYPALSSCLQTEYTEVTRDVNECRAHLIERTKDLNEVRRTLIERTATLEQVSNDLIDRTAELVGIREILIERTNMLERASTDLVARTEELVSTRQTLIERTRLLEQTREQMRDRDPGRE